MRCQGKCQGCAAALRAGIHTQAELAHDWIFGSPEATATAITMARIMAAAVCNCSRQPEPTARIIAAPRQQLARQHPSTPRGPPPAT